MPIDIASLAAFAALILAAVGLGGGVYESVLIDRVWPGNPALIQPNRGGIDRKRFWAPVHFAFELALIGALWAAWRHEAARNWLLAALGCHLAMRVWSFAYFIPRAMAFEKAGDLDARTWARAMTWTRASVWRTPLDLAAVVALCLAVCALVRPA